MHQCGCFLFECSKCHTHFIRDNIGITIAREPQEDVLVVAISPFNLIDEYGKTFDDINTRDEYKEKLEENKDLGIPKALLAFNLVPFPAINRLL